MEHGEGGVTLVSVQQVYMAGSLWPNSVKNWNKYEQNVPYACVIEAGFTIITGLAYPRGKGLITYNVYRRYGLQLARFSFVECQISSLSKKRSIKGCCLPEIKFTSKVLHYWCVQVDRK